MMPIPREINRECRHHMAEFKRERDRFTHAAPALLLSTAAERARWDSSDFWQMSDDVRASHWDGDEWLLTGDGETGSHARWIDDGGRIEADDGDDVDDAENDGMSDQTTNLDHPFGDLGLLNARVDNYRTIASDQTPPRFCVPYEPGFCLVESLLAWADDGGPQP